MNYLMIISGTLLVLLLVNVGIVVYGFWKLNGDMKGKTVLQYGQLIGQGLSLVVGCLVIMNAYGLSGKKLSQYK